MQSHVYFNHKIILIALQNNVLVIGITVLNKLETIKKKYGEKITILQNIKINLKLIINAN